ncbi:hypothetical protein E3P84_00927 [Wallemia ichthyophaga]|nr:hypothetical protein E3P84_00927 [Wallemia ichthyophaga]TIB44004.1 hypothetical protein E3P83_00329 [Wallemia ichthyophaga]
MSNPIATLNDGNKIPLVGYGTWCQSFEAGPKLLPSMKYFIEQGGRHFDGATLYCNEKEIAQAVKESGVPREEFFITTKVWITDLHKARESLEGSLLRTGLDYFDLLLVHWPQTTFHGTAEDPDDPSERNYLKVWKEFETFPETGKVKSIGVSNFSIPFLEDLLNSCTKRPAVNQIETHPWNPDFELIDYCHKNGIHVTAYCPVAGHTPLIKDHTINKIASEIGATPGQVLLSWGVQRGTSVIPKAANHDRIRENLKLVKLSPENVAAINKIHENPATQTRVNYGIVSNGKIFGWTPEQLKIAYGFPSLGLPGIKQM